MSINLEKGQKISLTKETTGLSKVTVGLGWDMAKKGIFGGSYDVDCDASAIIIGSDGKYQNVVYFGNRSALNKAVYHHGDNLTGAGDGDDERITVDLANMPSNVQKIIFVVNIFKPISRMQHFGMIKRAFIRLVDNNTNKEICKFNLSDNYNGKTAMIFAEVYKHENEWKFSAIGEGTKDTSIEALCAKYK